MTGSELARLLVTELVKRDPKTPVTYGELAAILRSVGVGIEPAQYEEGFPKMMVRQPPLSGFDRIDRAPGVPERKMALTSAEYHAAIREGFHEN